MSSYKLTYFSKKGLAEPIRFLLSYGLTDFEDIRINDDEWLNLKPSTAFGQLPLLEVDGKKISQSIAICRYLAKRFGLAGRTDWEDLEIDATVDTITDLHSLINAAYRETDYETKVKKLEGARVSVTFFIKKFDMQVKLNGGFFVGGMLTWADVIFAAHVDMLNFKAGYNVIEDAENLKKLVGIVLEEPKIKRWISKRPKTEY